MKIYFSDTIRVNVPAQRLWNILSDWAHPHGWVPQLKSCTLEGSIPHGLGAYRRIVEDDQILLERAIIWEDNHLISIRVEGVPRFVKNVTTTFSIDAISANESDFSVTGASDTGLGPIGVILSPFAKKAQRYELCRLLVAMKYFAETGLPAKHADVDKLLPNFPHLAQG